MPDYFVAARPADAPNVETGDGVFKDGHMSLRHQVGDVLLVGAPARIVPRRVTNPARCFNELLRLNVGVGLPDAELFQILWLKKVGDGNKAHNRFTKKCHRKPSFHEPDASQQFCHLTSPMPLHPQVARRLPRDYLPR